MTVLTSMMMPSFGPEERDMLQRIEGILARHPYLRVDLGSAGPLGRQLEAVLSARLALLHTEGAIDTPHAEVGLLRKLCDWEARLVDGLDEEPGSTEVRIRYETSLVLHPDPRSIRQLEVESTERGRLVADWERSRSRASAKTMCLRKLRQFRDFFRHGVTLPFYWARRRRIRKLVPKTVLENPALRKTYFAIEQVGPLVDSFAFEGKGGLPVSKGVALADVAFLYMQLADEFLDELAAAAGGHHMAGAVVRSVYQADTSKRPLHDLRLDHLRAAGVDPDDHETKFGLTLRLLFDILGELTATVDRALAASDPAVAHAALLFLHHCFQTYLDEVDLCERAPTRRADRLQLRDSAWHFYRKNNMVMMLWLDLRARLLGLDPSTHADAIRRWGYLLASFQIFDDLKDIALDLGNQPSYALQIAAHDFPEELAWLESRFGAVRAPLTRDEIPEVNLHASGTVRQCIQWSRLMALAHFDSALLYAWDQRWRKSWTQRHGSFNPDRGGIRTSRPHAVDRLARALLASLRSADGGMVDDERLAFALDASAYDGAWQIYLALFPDIRAMYRFATLRMWMSAEEKARAARRLLRRYPRERANALLDLADADVDHQISRDGLEAFAKLIEI